jgi:hypothetical protein
MGRENTFWNSYFLSIGLTYNCNKMHTFIMWNYNEIRSQLDTATSFIHAFIVVTHKSNMNIAHFLGVEIVNPELDNVYFITTYNSEYYCILIK